VWSEKRAAERARNDAGGHLFPDVGAHGTIAPVRQHAGKGCEQDGGEGCTKRQVLRRVHGKTEAVEKYVEQGHDDHRPADTEKPGKEPHKGTPKHKKRKHGKHDVPMAFSKRQKTIPIASSCREVPPGIQ
jgi:hypothetical protein